LPDAPEPPPPVNTNGSNDTYPVPPFVITETDERLPLLLNIGVAENPEPPPPVAVIVAVDMLYPVPATNPEYPVITPGLPPPDNVIVGSEEYPEPVFVIVILETVPLVKEQVAVAPEPVSPDAVVIVIVGADV
jgi:hypothetical protein